MPVAALQIRRARQGQARTMQGNPAARSDQAMALSFTGQPGKLRASLPSRAGRAKCSQVNGKNCTKEFIPRTMRPKKIILCVDDNEQELSVLKFMLATNGYRVVSATNGQEAIGIFAETPWTWCWPTLPCRR
jgi:hypothetical protein